MPAPPPESEPAIERHTGTRSAMGPMIGREYDRLDDGRRRDPLHDERGRNEHRVEALRRRRRRRHLARRLRRPPRVSSSEQPRLQRFFDRVGAFARVVAFDKRGQGLSDRPDRAATMEEHAEDALAVMDAARPRAPHAHRCLRGRPRRDRVRSRASGPYRQARVVRHLRPPAPSTTTTPTAQRCGTWTASRERALTDWGDPVALHGFAPSMADDRAFGAWWARLLRHGVSRSGVRHLLDTWEHLDVRAALPLRTRADARDVPQHDRMTPFAWSAVPRRPHRGRAIRRPRARRPPLLHGGHRADAARAARLRHRDAGRTGAG